MVGRRVAFILMAGALATPWVLASPVASSVESGPAVAATSELAMSDGAKRELILDVLENFVAHAETFRRPSDLAEPRTDYFAATGPGVTQPRGGGNIALVYATLLVGRPDQASFAGVSREEMIETTIQSIRHEALTNRLSGAGYNRWGAGTWQAALETYGWAWAAHLLWNHVDADTRDLVERVLTAEADILLTKPIATGSAGNTGAEDNGWNSPVPALAAVMFPDHPNREAWEQRAITLALNASSSAPDESSAELVDGQPLSEWMESVNIHPDLTMENHGFFNPIYQQVVHVNIGEAAAIYGAAGHPIPEGFSFRTEEIWDRVLGPLAADDGDLVMPAGQDWTSKDYQHLDYLTILATRFGRADASVAESRALSLVAQRQATHESGAIIGQPQLGYESMLVKRLAAAWWNHELFGPSPQPTPAEYEAARSLTAGVRQLEYVGVVQARQRDAFTSMSWTRPMGLVVPAATGHEDDPIFAAYLPGSLTGSASGAVGPYTCDCTDDYFSTAGTIGSRAFSMTSFPDGMTMLLDRGAGTTFTVGLERIPGLADDRPIYSAGGTGIGSLPGSWVNADDRLGMVVAGGSGIRVRDVASGNPHRLIEGSVNTGSGNRGAAIYPLTSHSDTAELAESVVQPDVPESWSALFAPGTDGTGRFAVGRWGGSSSVSLTLTDERGGPVTSWPTEISGTSASVDVSLDAPSSRGEIVRWFVSSSADITASLDGEAVTLTNDTDTATTVDVTYVGADGEVSATRSLFAGEQITARIIDDEVVLAGPEYEPLVAADDVLASLTVAIDDWEADGSVTPDTADSLRETVAESRKQIDLASSEALAVDPNTGPIETFVHVARNATERLRASDAPDHVRERVDTDRQTVFEYLDSAASAFGSTVRLSAPDAVQPGEPATFVVTVAHRGLLQATGGTVSLAVPDGWTVSPPSTDVERLRPESSVQVSYTVTPADDADIGATATIGAQFEYEWAGSAHSAETSVDVPVSPLLTVSAAHPDLPLAAGGWNRATVTVTNTGSRPLPVEMLAEPPDGVTAEPVDSPTTVEPGASADLSVDLRNNAGPAEGTADLDVITQVADTPGASAVTTTLRLHFSDNLALNALATPWPSAFADSNQANYPPSLANDGQTATFWVSDGAAAGDGPSPEKPNTLGVDFGTTLDVGTVVMTPRPNYGPRDYTIEVSDDGQTWTEVGAASAAPASGPTTTALPAATQARYVRLVITDSWDRIRPPRNVQVAELTVHAP